MKNSDGVLIIFIASEVFAARLYDIVRDLHNIMLCFELKYIDYNNAREENQRIQRTPNSDPDPIF